MATKQTFSVSKSGHSGHNVERMLPDSLKDREGWKALIEGDVDAAIHELALQQFIVKCQAAARGSLEKGKAATQAKASAYKYGARGGVSAPVVDAKGAGFTKEQIAGLRAAGVTVINAD